MSDRTRATPTVEQALRAGHLLDVCPLDDSTYRWFGECHRPGEGYERCFTFAPASDAETIRLRWLEHVAEDVVAAQEDR